MYSITKLSAGMVLLAGFVLTPAYGAMARDWGSHGSQANRESHESHADRPHSDRGDRAPSQNNFSPKSFQGGSPPPSHNMSTHNMPPRGFHGTPPSFKGNARSFARPDSRNFQRDFNGSQARDFRRAPPRDFGNRTTRDFQRPSHNVRGGQQQSQGMASHQFHGFHGHDVAQFTPQEREHWRHGNWHHGHHHGHNGWWFIVDDFWFFYDFPIYPYPGYVSYYYDDGYYGDQSDYYWYWCDDPQGYYPYVQECYGPWRPVSPSPEAYDSGDYGYGDYGSDDYGPDGSDYGPDR